MLFISCETSRNQSFHYEHQDEYIIDNLYKYKNIIDDIANYKIIDTNTFMGLKLNMDSVACLEQISILKSANKFKERRIYNPYHKIYIYKYETSLKIIDTTDENLFYSINAVVSLYWDNKRLKSIAVSLLLPKLLNVEKDPIENYFLANNIQSIFERKMFELEYYQILHRSYAEEGENFQNQIKNLFDKTQEMLAYRYGKGHFIEKVFFNNSYVWFGPQKSIMLFDENSNMYSDFFEIYKKYKEAKEEIIFGQITYTLESETKEERKIREEKEKQEVEYYKREQEQKELNEQQRSKKRIKRNIEKNEI